MLGFERSSVNSQFSTFPRRVFRGGSLLAVLAAAGALIVGCSADTRPPVELDCSVEDGLEFKEDPALFDFEGAALEWFGFGDCTPGALLNNCIGSEAGLGTIPAANGPLHVPVDRCDSTQALRLRSTGHQDWGSGFGEFATAGDPTGANGEEYEGISFWARSPGNTTKQFQFMLEDVNTSASGGVCNQCDNHGDCAGTGTPECGEGVLGNALCVCSADITTDPSNCGACGTICPLGQWCNGACVSTTCESDDDCNAGTPFCVGDTCVECLDDSDCSAELCGTGECGPGGRCLFEDGTDDDDTCGDTEVCDGEGLWDCTDNVSTGFISEVSGQPTIVVPGNFCGNNFRAQVSLTDDWELYLFPFEVFAQDPLPSRSPTGIARNQIVSLGFTIPKEAELDFLVDDIRFYRHADQ